MKTNPLEGWRSATPDEAMVPLDVLNPKMSQKERGMAMMLALKAASIDNPGGKLVIQYVVGHNERMEPVIGVAIGSDPTGMHGLSLNYTKFMVAAIGMYVTDFPHAPDAEFVAEFARGLAETIKEAEAWGTSDLTKQ